MNEPTASRRRTVFGAATIAVAGVVSIGIVVDVFRAPKPDDLSAITVTQQNLTDIETAALLKLQPCHSVCDEILRRDAVSTEQLEGALLFLARQKRIPTLRVLITRTQELSDESSTTELVNLTRLFASLVSESDGWRDDVIHLTRSKSAPTRKVAYATQILIDDGLKKMVRPEADDDQITDVLQALPLVASESLQQAIYDDLKQIIAAEETTPSTREAAIEVSTQLSGRQAEKTRDLVTLLRKKQHVEPSLRAINQLPPETWPDDQIGFLAASLISWVADQPDIQSNSKRTILARSLGKKLTHRLEPSGQARFQSRMAELLGA